MAIATVPFKVNPKAATGELKAGGAPSAMSNIFGGSANGATSNYNV